MAKRFSNFTLPDNVNWHKIIEGQTGKDITVNINISNHNSVDAKVTIAMVAKVSASSISNMDDILFLDRLVFARDTREIRGVVVPSDMAIYAKADYANVTFLSYGFEEDI
jgi:hypothetical protein